MRVTDYIAQFIYCQGVDTVFLVSGGGAMFLDDGLACNSNLKKICCHHEQAAGMAAVGYAKYSGLGCAYVTTGCGGTNAITAVLQAWQDSTPCIFISGQIKRSQTIRNSGLALRQFGVQEADIIALVSPIVKYAEMVNESNDIALHLEKAVYLAKSGRPGPVWLDIPMDVQSAVIDESGLSHFTGAQSEPAPSREEYAKLTDLIKKAKRPVIVAGQGIRLANTRKELSDFINLHKIPVASPYLGVGVLPTTDPLYTGVIGLRGSRAGNYTIQNADLLLVLGSRLSVSSTGHEYELFAPNAHIAVVDVDPVEHSKNTIHIDTFIHSELKEFFKGFPNFDYVADSVWTAQCLAWKEKYPVCLPEYVNDEDGINLNYFVKILSENMNDTDVVVSDAGSSAFVTSQTIEIRNTTQRYIASGGQMEMGFTLPGTIGVSAARNKERVIGITGDGSLQMNLQELQTLIYNKIPVKLFVWNNDGYLSIRATQMKFFEGRFFGTDSESGVSFPSIEKLALCYGLPYVRIEKSRQLSEKISQVLSTDGPVLCEVICQKNQVIVPCVTSKLMPDGKLVSMPIDNMFPFLPDEEHALNTLW